LTTNSLIAPLGEHRKTHIQPSKGKKRKRKSKDANDASTTATTEAPPPPPEVGKHILIGINSITRHLEALAAQHAPPSTPVVAANENLDEQNEPLQPLSIVILTHPKPSSSPAHAHFPTLVHLSTLQAPSSSSAQTTATTTTTNTAPPTRLIPMPSSTDARLASALHIPRVSALAIIADAPGAKALEAFVRDNVGATACAWIDEAVRAEWRGVNVRSEVVGGKQQTGKVIEK
jgi:ribonuclease P/MRP protein subunit POP3